MIVEEITFGESNSTIGRRLRQPEVPKIVFGTCQIQLFTDVNRNHCCGQQWDVCLSSKCVNFKALHVALSHQQTSFAVLLVHVDIYVPPTTTYLQYRVIGLTHMAVGLLQSLAQQSGTVSRISSGTRQSALTLSDVYWRRICLRYTSACSALEVDNFIWIYLLTYLLVGVYRRISTSDWWLSRLGVAPKQRDWRSCRQSTQPTRVSYSSWWPGSQTSRHRSTLIDYSPGP